LPLDRGRDECNRENVKDAMRRVPVTRHSKERGVVRAGRPPRRLAGEVDARILDAARRLFLERGLEGTSVDEIASLARAGKPTIYARFPSKETLFTAVVMRAVHASIERFESDAPTGANVEERLESVGVTILKWVLVSETIGMIRLAIAEARRLPHLASQVSRMARERGEEAFARLLGEVAQSDELGKLPAFAPERLATTTRFFRDLVVLPLFLRALYGEKLKVLHAEIGPQVARSVAFFLAACRHDGVN
jgi:AcrR family transcriptional regulator